MAARRNWSKHQNRQRQSGAIVVAEEEALLIKHASRDTDYNQNHKRYVEQVERVLRLIECVKMSDETRDRMVAKWRRTAKWLEDNPTGVLIPDIARSLHIAVTRLTVCNMKNTDFPDLPPKDPDWKPKPTFRRPKQVLASFLTGDTSSLPKKPPKRVA